MTRGQRGKSPRKFLNVTTHDDLLSYFEQLLLLTFTGLPRACTMRTDMNSTGKIAVQNFKRSVGALIASLSVMSTAVHALQTVDPRLTVGGATIAGSTQNIPAGTQFTFYGVYSDDSAVTATNTTGAESGLGLKVKYNGLHLTNVVIDEQYTKCRIAAAQYPATDIPPTAPTATDQAVMGWIDTAIRPLGAVASANGSVGWPDLPDQASTGLCLNPGNINTIDTAVVTPSGLKLFRFTAKMAAGCTTSALCSSTVTFDSEGNYSYASTTPGMQVKTFNIAGAPAPTIALTGGAARGLHTGSLAGNRDIAIVAAFGAGATTAAAASDTTITTEPRRGAGASLDQFTAVMTFNAAPTSGTGSVVSCLVWNGTAAVACAANPTVSSVTFDGATNSASILLAGVVDQSRVRIRLSNVNGSGLNADLTIGFLLGDVQNDRATNAGDINQVKAQSGTLTPTARFDVNRDGAINTGDINTVKASSGRKLP